MPQTIFLPNSVEVYDITSRWYLAGSILWMSTKQPYPAIQCQMYPIDPLQILVDAWTTSLPTDERCPSSSRASNPPSRRLQAMAETRSDQLLTIILWGQHLSPAILPLVFLLHESHTHTASLRTFSIPISNEEIHDGQCTQSISIDILLSTRNTQPGPPTQLEEIT